MLSALQCIFLTTSVVVASSKFLHRNAALVPPAEVLPNEDPYAVYDGKYLVKLSACNQKSLGMVMASLKDTDCNFLNEDGSFQLPTEGCGVEHVVCSSQFADKVVARDVSSSTNKHGLALFREKTDASATIANKDAGHFFRQMGGFCHGFDPQVQWDSNGQSLPDAFYSEYRNLDAIEKRMKELTDGSGGVAVLKELTPMTVENRTIKAVHIRDASWSAGKPRVVLTFQLHAREWISGMTGMYTVEHLINSVKQKTFDITGMEIVIVPISNPDGFAYSATTNRLWRKNRRLRSNNANAQPICDGVDLNRNWASQPGWAQSSPCSEVYHGISHQSEQESLALGSLIQEAPTSVFIDIHNYGQVIIAPSLYPDLPEATKANFDRLGNGIEQAIHEVHQTPYHFYSGPSACRAIAAADAIACAAVWSLQDLAYPTKCNEVMTAGGAKACTYKTGTPALYAVTNTIADWATSKGILGLTIELRPGSPSPGFVIAPDQILPAAEEALQGFYAAFTLAKNFPPGLAGQL